jgi:hypothetical protein
VKTLTRRRREHLSRPELIRLLKVLNTPTLRAQMTKGEEVATAIVVAYHLRGLELAMKSGTVHEKIAAARTFTSIADFASLILVLPVRATGSAGSSSRRPGGHRA